MATGNVPDEAEHSMMQNENEHGVGAGEAAELNQTELICGKRSHSACRSRNAAETTTTTRRTTMATVAPMFA